MKNFELPASVELLSGSKCQEGYKNNSNYLLIVMKKNYVPILYNNSIVIGNNNKLHMYTQLL